MTAGTGANRRPLARAQALADAGKLTQAYLVFREALAPSQSRANPRDLAAALVGLGNIEFLRGDIRRGRAYAREALAHDPYSQPARALMADVCDKDGQTEAAAVWRGEPTS